MFQSSPGPEAGCNARRGKHSQRGFRFQSSPGPEAGCNSRFYTRPRVVRDVSILTRPGGRV